MSDKEMLLKLTIAQETLSKTLVKMEENLQKLNDSNILHQTKTMEEHNNFAMLMSKFWYIILVLCVILGMIAGAKGIENLIPK
jgi:hypothetical protein